MRLVSVRTEGGATRVGVVVGDEVAVLPGSSVQEVVAEGQVGLETAARQAARGGVSRLPLPGLDVVAPLRPHVVVAPGPRIDPAHETRLRRHREFYLKSGHTVIGPTDPVAYRGTLGTLSYRAQLGLVLGPTPRHVTAARALDSLLGVVVVAELYSIDLLRIGWEGTMWHVRYGEGASFDGACPTGGFFVTPDELELDGLLLEDATGGATVNRERVAEFVSYVARWMAFGPSTLILAGSSHGPVLSVEGRDPVVRFPEAEPRLGPGDMVTARAGVLGTIEATVWTTAASGGQ